MADRNVNIWLRLKNVKGVGSGIKKLGGGFISMGKRAISSLRGIGRSILNLKNLIVGVLIYGALRLAARAFRTLTAAASEAEETQAKFGAVFKHLTAEGRAWAENFAESVGRSKTAVKGWMATLQDTFVPLGFTREKALELTQQLTALGVDLASFNNIESSEAIERLTSALVGNHETVRKFGVIITEANLKDEAYASGIAAAGSELTNAQKVQARYNLILKSTTDAQGDAIRTADSYTNRQRRLGAMWLDLKERLGKFLTESQGVSRIFGSLGTAVKDLTAWFEKNQYAIQSLVDEGFVVLADKAERLFVALNKFAEDGTFLNWAEDTKTAMHDTWAWTRIAYGGAKAVWKSFQFMGTSVGVAATLGSRRYVEAWKETAEEGMDALGGIARAWDDLSGLTAAKMEGLRLESELWEKPKLATLLPEDSDEALAVFSWTAEVMEYQQKKITAEKERTAAAERDIADAARRTLDLTKAQKSALADFAMMGRLKQEAIVSLLQRAPEMTAEKFGRLGGVEKEMISGYKPLQKAYSGVAEEYARGELERKGITKFAGVDLKALTTPEKIEAVAKVEVTIHAGEDIAARVGDAAAVTMEELFRSMEEVTATHVQKHRDEIEAAAVALRLAG